MHRPAAPLVDVRKSHPGKAGRKPVRYMDRTDRKRPLPITPKQYELTSNLIKVFDLMSMRVPVAKIAVVMNKPESTIRSWMKMIAADFSSLVQSAEANQIIDEHLATLHSARRKAFEIMQMTTEGDQRKLQAAATVKDIDRTIHEYEVTVGRVKKAPDDLRVQGAIGLSANRPIDVDAIVDEISDDDLDAVLLTIADSIRDKQKEKRAEVIEVQSVAEPVGAAVGFLEDSSSKG